jgi:hypothetical protein
VPGETTTSTTLADPFTTGTTFPTDSFVVAAGTSGGTGGGSLPTTGLELWHALVGLALIYVGRVLYLLGRSHWSATRS